MDNGRTDRSKPAPAGIHARVHSVLQESGNIHLAIVSANSPVLLARHAKHAGVSIG